MDTQAVFLAVVVNSVSCNRRISGDCGDTNRPVWFVIFATTAKEYCAAKLCLTLPKYGKSTLKLIIMVIIIDT